MCFHYALSAKAQTVANRYNQAIATNLQFGVQHYINGFSRPHMPIVSPNGLELASWGLVPDWVTNRTQRDEIWKKTLNARSETVFQKPSFKNAILHQRCLVPATGFFEWKKVGKKKFPYFIRLKGEDIFSFGGIFSIWEDEFGQVEPTFSIITVEANSLMEDIHNEKFRMPFIVKKKDEMLWISNINEGEIQNLMRSYDDNFMEAWSVGPLINRKELDKNVEKINSPFLYPELQKGLF